MSKKLTKTIILIVFVVFLGMGKVEAYDYIVCKYTADTHGSDGKTITYKVRIDSTGGNVKRVSGTGAAKKAEIQNWKKNPDGFKMKFTGEDYFVKNNKIKCPPKVYIADFAFGEAQAFFYGPDDEYDTAKNETILHNDVDKILKKVDIDFLGFTNYDWYYLTLTDQTIYGLEEPDEKTEEPTPEVVVCTGSDEDPSWCIDPSVNIVVSPLSNDLSTYSCGEGFITGIPKRIPRLTHSIYNFIQILVPIALVILGILDFIKALSAQKEDEIKAGLHIFIKRIITSIIVFFVFAIIKFIVSVVSDHSTTAIDCLDCFIKNDSCVEEE